MASLKHELLLGIPFAIAVCLGIWFLPWWAIVLGLLISAFKVTRL